MSDRAVPTTESAPPAERADPLHLSVIIVSWNVRDLLRECLRSLREHTRLPPAQYEVIVVDNASQDGTTEMLRSEFPWVHCIENAANYGFGKANNQALPLCGGTHLLLLNPDTLIRDDAVGGMLERMTGDPSLAVLGCRLAYGDGRFQRWTAGRFPSLWSAACHYLFLDKLLPPVLANSSMFLSFDITRDRDVDWISGACLMLRRDAVGDSIFDERYFMYGEDLDLCNRIKQAGGRIRYTPAVTVVHYHGQSTKQQTIDVSANSLQGQRKFFADSHGPAALFVFDAIVIAGFWLRSLLFAMSGVLVPAHRQRRDASRHLLRLARRVRAGQ